MKKKLLSLSLSLALFGLCLSSCSGGEETSSSEGAEESSSSSSSESSSSESSSAESSSSESSSESSSPEEAAYAVTVTPSSTSVSVGESVSLSASVLHGEEEVSDYALSYAVYDDEALETVSEKASISEASFRAEEGGTYYVVGTAEIGELTYQSEAVQIEVDYFFLVGQNSGDLSLLLDYFSYDSETNVGTYSPFEGLSFTYDQSQVSNPYWSSGQGLRFYENGVLTISSTLGNIGAVSFTATGSSHNEMASSSSETAHVYYCPDETTTVYLLKEETSQFTLTGGGTSRLSSVSITLTDSLSLSLAEEITLSAELHGYGGESSELSFSWKSGDESVATVASGVVSPVGVGSASIGAEAAVGEDSYGDSITVTVTHAYGLSLSVTSGEESVTPDSDGVYGLTLSSDADSSTGYSVSASVTPTLLVDEVADEDAQVSYAYALYEDEEGESSAEAEDASVSEEGVLTAYATGTYYLRVSASSSEGESLASALFPFKISHSAENLTYVTTLSEAEEVPTYASSFTWSDDDGDEDATDVAVYTSEDGEVTITYVNNGSTAGHPSDGDHIRVYGEDSVTVSVNSGLIDSLDFVINGDYSLVCENWKCGEESVSVTVEGESGGPYSVTPSSPVSSLTFTNENTSQIRFSSITVHLEGSTMMYEGDQISLYPSTYSQNGEAEETYAFDVDVYDESSNGYVDVTDSNVAGVTSGEDEGGETVYYFTASEAGTYQIRATGETYQASGSLIVSVNETYSVSLEAGSEALALEASLAEDGSVSWSASTTLTASLSVDGVASTEATYSYAIADSDGQTVESGASVSEGVFTATVSGTYLVTATASLDGSEVAESEAVTITVSDAYYASLTVTDEGDVTWGRKASYAPSFAYSGGELPEEYQVLYRTYADSSLETVTGYTTINVGGENSESTDGSISITYASAGTYYVTATLIIDGEEVATSEAVSFTYGETSGDEENNEEGEDAESALFAIL